MSRTFVANGNIKPYRFVRADATAGEEGKVLQSTDGSGSHGSSSIGISQEGSRLLPGITDTNYAAADEQELQVYTEGDECFLCVGAAVTYGDNLKSDSDGRGITASVAEDLVGAKALQTATAANELIKVMVTINRHVPTA